jgi:hypothetical protein
METPLVVNHDSSGGSPFRTTVSVSCQGTQVETEEMYSRNQKHSGSVFYQKRKEKL